MALEVQLCREDSKDRHKYIDAALGQGYTVYLKNRNYIIFVLDEPNYWRSPSAQFESMESGIYEVQKTST